MSIKSDHWIRRMAENEKMIEPFAREQVRQADGHKIVSYGTSSYGYDVRCSREFKIFTNINSTIVDPKNFDEKSFVDMHGGRVHHPAELLRAGAHRGILPHSALDAGSLSRKIDVCALRCNRERNAFGAGVGRARDARVLQHHAAAREDLRQRGRGADAVLRVGRGVLDVVQGPRREVPGPDGRHAPEDLVSEGSDPISREARERCRTSPRGPAPFARKCLTHLTGRRTGSAG